MGLWFERWSLDILANRRNVNGRTTCSDRSSEYRNPFLQGTLLDLDKLEAADSCVPRDEHSRSTNS
jgi:hypothetical protein